jgi:hypothetical protein
MGIMRRLNSLDARLGIARAGPREGQSRRDYLEGLSRRSLLGYENPHVYRELVELHDRVAVLEKRLDVLERLGRSR